jgi:hypothetical protein
MDFVAMVSRTHVWAISPWFFTKIWTLFNR